MEVREEDVQGGEGELEVGEGGGFRRQEVAKTLEGRVGNGGPDTVLGIGEDRGKEVDPQRTSGGEVSTEEGVDTINGNRLIDIHDDGGVRSGLGKGVDGENTTFRHGESDRGLTGVVEPRGVDGGE